MKKRIEFNPMNGDTWEHSGEWSMEDAIDWSFVEAEWQAETEAEERELEQCRELIMKFHQERNNKNDQ